MISLLQNDGDAAVFNCAGRVEQANELLSLRDHLFLIFTRKAVNEILRDMDACFLTIHIMENCQACCIHKQVKWNKSISPLALS